MIFGADFGGRVTGYFQHRDAGFAGTGSYTADEINQFGGPFRSVWTG